MRRATPPWRNDIHFANGLVDEVQELLNAGVNDHGNALGAHGYRRVCEFLRGERTLESAVEFLRSDEWERGQPRVVKG